ncbi:hypothetical protein SAMN05660443_0657 [Marinospirillum celere]|uniref:Uncharacterized protein n=1 Tax=Marinospirillum celere TaxID=1122252 RepID=A0A1I1EJT7_9GAMM|nr:hypothetical protein [Marinospirillum celere]SFB87419.1 hypothetical protein SAMN05660443_0657 [Marinospirillum celere]
MNKYFFLSQQYMQTLELLKRHELWDFELGIELRPLIQYCLPPPTLENIYLIVRWLEAMDFNEDWANLDLLKRLSRKLRYHPERNPDEYIKEYGSSHPVAAAIRKVHNLEWDSESKRQAISSLLSTVFEHTGPAELLDDTDYYLDVYQLRDTILAKLAAEKGLPLQGNTTKGLEAKNRHTAPILDGRRWLGCAFNELDSDQSFWRNPPHLNFTHTVSDSQKPKTPKKPDSDQQDQNPNQIELNDSTLTNSEQFYELHNFVPHWVRSNVRSHANSYQLSWSSIIRYWSFLLDKNRLPQLYISVLALVIGLPKRRWSKATVGKAPELEGQEIIFDPVNQCLFYRVLNGATNFEHQNRLHTSEIVGLALPKSLGRCLDEHRSVFEEGVKEERAVRDFSANHPGPSTGINQMARSGHCLLRSCLMSEVSAFTLAGNLPIEFRARACYVTTTNATINQNFRCTVSLLKTEINQRLSSDHPLRKQINTLLEECYKEPVNFHVGSQLGHKPPLFSDIQPPRLSGDQVLEKANGLELHFYWMLQYAYANRPVGPGTETFLLDNFRLHRDKDSADFFESKLIFEHSLVQAQFQELMKCRQALFQQNSQALTDETSRPIALYHQQDRASGMIASSPLQSQQASQLAKNYWSLAFNHDRTNASRHQCATFAHKLMSENHADLWLGHHIDGWDALAPFSTAHPELFNELEMLQSQWLEKLGFKLKKSPLS